MAGKPSLLRDRFRDDHHKEPHRGFAADLSCFAAIESAVGQSFVRSIPICCLLPNGALNACDGRSKIQLML
jgi:hypothetical protein